ncbi:MAG: DUF1127 domain-containing protein [Pseudomonadota bacterium]
MSSIHYTPTTQTARPVFKGFAQLLVSVAAGIGRTLMDWQARSSDRAHLQELPDYMLKDMGLTRVDADRESAKPFWRA